MKVSFTIILLVLSNAFMTLAWYGHLKYQSTTLNNLKALMGIIFISWGIAFFEYCLQVPANRLGYSKNGGPFSLIQLKIIQEAISLTVFIIFTIVLFKNELFTKNHIFSFVFIMLAVYFAFKK